MPEIGMEIGRCPEIFSRSNEEVLSCYDDRGDRYLHAEEKEVQARAEAVQARAEADQSKQRTDKLLAKLQELGIDADSLE
jgi:lipocalin